MYTYSCVNIGQYNAATFAHRQVHLQDLVSRGGGRHVAHKELPGAAIAQLGRIENCFRLRSIETRYCEAAVRRREVPVADGAIGACSDEVRGIRLRYAADDGLH